MRSIDFFHIESPVHRVREEPGGFTIYPISKTPSDIANFQSIARQAALYSGSDFRILPHPSGCDIDEVFFGRQPFGAS